MKKLIAGNWKMNGTLDEALELGSRICESVAEDAAILEKADVLICPPALYISELADVCGEGAVCVGAQDCSAHESGAYTGEVSAEMIKSAGASYVIVGHSERRQYHNEDDAFISVKAAKALANGLVPIICVGESEKQREDGLAFGIVEEQLKGSIPELAADQEIVIAYEPVWAIGTGKTATPDDVNAMHDFIREKLADIVPDAAAVRILYGGSMKPENAAELLACKNVDGGLIGGASLVAESFLAIAKKA